MRLPSFHDDYLVGYQVDFEARTIDLRIRHAETGSTSLVQFSEVEGHSFENPAAGNIILDIEEKDASELFAELGGEIVQAFRQSGAPGSWAADLEKAASSFDEAGIKAFVISPSFGMWGWILAGSVQVAAQQVVAADI